MPRRHPRRAEEPGPPPRRPTAEAPSWALVPDAEVRRVSASKTYRCPGCDHEIRVGVWHLVVVPREDAEARRHWHEGCWRIELKRTRGRRAR